MAKRLTPGLAILSLVLLASCGRAAGDADDTVTAKLPRETAVAGPSETSPASAEPVPDEAAPASAQAPDSSQATVQPAELPTSGRSRYTSLEPASCKVLEEGAERAGSSRRRCEGFAGYALETSEADPRQSLAIVAPDGERSELDLSGIATNGTLGKLAEWRRGAAGRPRAVIVRVSDAARKPVVSSLIVAKLDSPACIVAVIDRGPGQNEKARAAADRKQLECNTPSP